MTISEIIFYIANKQVSLAFYQKLGFLVEKDDGSYVCLKLVDNNIMLSLNTYNEHAAKRGFGAIVIEEPRTHELHKKWVKIFPNNVGQVEIKPWAKTFTVTDPDGNLLEVKETK